VGVTTSTLITSFSIMDILHIPNWAQFVDLCFTILSCLHFVCWLGSSHYVRYYNKINKIRKRNSLLCVLCYWPQDDPLRSKHVAKLTLRQSLCISQTSVTFVLFLWKWNKCADVLLSSCLRCVLGACGVGSF
jgi:hypothetical protein